MFKRTLKSVALLLASVILAACGGMRNANAQASDHLFKDQNGRPFNIDNVLTFQPLNGFVYVSYIGGASYTNLVADGTGAVYTALLASPYVQKKFVQIGVSAKYLNTTLIVAPGCGNNNSQWVPGIGQPTVVVQDACQTYSAIQAKSN